MQKVRSLNNLIILTLVFLVCSCSFFNKKISYSLCPPINYTRQDILVTFDEKLEKSTSVIVKISGTPTTLKESLHCILATEYDTTSNKKGLKLITFLIKDTGTVLQYALNFDMNVLLELQFSKNSTSDYVITVSSMLPLNNIIENIKAPELKRYVTIVDQKRGVISKVNFLKLMSDSTNGLLFKEE